MDPIWESVHQERAALIRDLGQLDPDDWAIETQCQGWRVREVVAHLIDTATTTPLSFLTAMVRAKFDFDRQNDLGLKRYNTSDPAELVALLGQVAERTSGPPQFMAPLASRLVEEIVHGEDIRRAVGLHRTYQAEDLKTAISYQATTSTRFGGFRENLTGKLLTAEDLGWSRGEGAQIVGPAVEILMLISGRAPRRGELTGPGLESLR